MVAEHGIGQFHDVVEIALRVVAPYMQDMHQTIRRARYRLVALDACELAFVRSVTVELLAPDDLYRARRAHDVPRQPDLSVGAAPNRAAEGVIRDDERAAHESI